MKKKSVIILALLLLSVVAAVRYVINRSVQSRIGPEHVFQLAESPPVLNEETALSIARQTLTKEGFDSTAWRVDGEARANLLNSNRLVFVFTNSSASKRFVSVELAGSRVICQNSMAK